MKKLYIVGIALVVAVVAYFGYMSFAPDATSMTDESQSQLISRKKAGRSPERQKTVTRIAAKTSRTKGGLNSMEGGKAFNKTDFSGALQAAADQDLSDLEREIIAGLKGLVSLQPGGLSQGASAYGELARLLKLASLPKNARLISVATKRALLGAAQSLGSGSGSSEVAAALLDYLSDADAEIAQSAFAQFIESVSDFSLSDRERAQLVVAASITMTDVDELGWAFAQFPTMRHSVAVDAFEQVAKSGNPTAQSLLAEQISNYTGDDSIVTPEQAKQWLAQPENADGADDESFYGGMKPGDGIGI